MRLLQFNSATLPEDRWLALCRDAAEATIFHYPVWSRIWESVRPDTRAVWYVLVGENGEWQGGMPLVEFSRFGIIRLYAQPQGSYGGWISRSQANDIHEISALIAQLVRRRVAEMVITPYPSDDRIMYPGHRVDRQRYVLDLSCGARWRNNIRPDLARNLKTAQQHQWRISQMEHADEIGPLQGLLEQTAVRHGRRFHAVRLKFFRKIVEHFPVGRQLFWWIASDDNGPAATIICFHAGDRFFYYDGAMDAAGKAGRPMYALFEKAIDAALGLGCRTFDFGSGPEQAEGLARFKSGWGARPETYYEYHFRRVWWPKRR